MRAAGKPTLPTRLTGLVLAAVFFFGPGPVPAGLAADKALSGPPVYTYRVVRSHSHDPTAFTQGLAYDGGRLIEGTGGFGRSALRLVELSTGRVLRERALPGDVFGEGVTVMRDRVFQLTWKTGRGFIYDRKSFTLTGGFSYTGQGWGLTHDGRRLIMSNGGQELIFLDPDTFAVTGRVEVTDGGVAVRHLNELEFVRGRILANVWHSDRVARIDPETGRVTGWIDLDGLLQPPARRRKAGVLNGIAYAPDGDRLFVTGKLWPRLYEIKLVPKAP